jgi:PhnB protein
MSDLYPFLAVRDVDAAVAFYAAAFGATTVRISLHVDDPDAVAAQAIAAGAREMFPVADQPYGLRQGRVVDPFGHHWLIGRPLS